jgi:threonine/homoserine/homoserine lactone efflux protein
MTYELIIALMAFAFVTSITPGPNNLMLMASGIIFGLSKSIPHIMGVGIGFILMILLVGLGLAEIFEIFPMSYTLLKFISIIYLSYLAWKIAMSGPMAEKTTADKAAKKPITFIQAALFQWVNPKAWIMTVTAISTYTPSAQSFQSVLIVAFIFGLIMIPSVSAWTFLGIQMQRLLNSPIKLKIFNFMAAALLIASLLPMIMETPL